ncbi:hypothetical protein BDV38DRAFT_268318 [Aspergillus pseudotamarii]|uniref:BZIP domain-containing protein n=1 Tax=Aspergillus pseudotamarii TaxID=132259 RepID=A0A5N6T5B3_ASPPS|nr:uncharacterized protein BDV38DRAFT_268318 [Aspergillus pseudotamarii]KAE8141506.1 hypothetical protein BDV38DRAFT_268318 [Aspergillus pseudotamarii]
MADYLLSQTLSARYYQPDRFPHISEAIGAEPGSDHGQIVEQRSSPEPSQSANRDRRAQIRAAQRTYRLKREAMFQDLKTRVSELEESMGRISQSLSTFYHMAIQSDLNLTHPYLFQQLNYTVSQVNRAGKLSNVNSLTTAEIHHIELAALSSAKAANDAFTFGYTMNRNPGESGTFYKPPGSDRIRVSPSTKYANRSYLGNLPRDIERPLNGSATFTYSYNEPTFARRLHRYCIEYAYQLFTDPRTDPQDIYRVFRLVTCVRQEDKMARCLTSLLRAGPKEPLERPKVPFYCIGGAGTHYPQMQPDGKPLYPENMRLPGRVLGSIPGSTQEMDNRPPSEKRQELLKIYGLDGTWLDCRDVQGYLEEKGFCLDDSPCIFATPTLENQENSPQASLNQSKGTAMDLDDNHEPKSPPLRNYDGADERVSGKAGNAAGPAACVLNIEEFVQALLRKMVILGRAPGFRLTDVETAFKSAAKVSSS